MPLLEEEGRYNAKVTAAELNEVGENNTPCVQLTFETDEGSISGSVWLSDKAFDRSLGVLKECFEFDGNFEDLKPLVGQECSITTELEEYKDEKRLKVKWLNPKGGPKLEAGARKSLAERLNAKTGFAATTNADKDPF